MVDKTCKVRAFVCFRDQNDRSPLHLAALKGSAQCCEAILQKFDDCVNWTDKNKVIFFAVYLKVITNYKNKINFVLCQMNAEERFNRGKLSLPIKTIL